MNKETEKPHTDPQTSSSSAPAEPPRILDRMMLDLKSSLDDKPVLANEQASDPVPPRPASTTVKIPTHQLEPAPDTVFSQPPEKPPKRLPKPIAGKVESSLAKAIEQQENPPLSTPAPSNAPSDPKPDEDTGEEGTPPFEETGWISKPLRWSWMTLGIASLALFNVILIVLLLVFLRATLPSSEHTAIDEEYPHSPPPEIVEPPEDIPAISPPEPPDPVLPPEPVATLPPLDISKLELTRGVTGFALYDPIPDIALLPRHVDHMFVYTEISHPKPEEREDGRYIYNLTKNVLLFRADVGPTEPLMNTTISLVERGLSPRRDFYARQQLQSARRIEPGEHIVEVRISDRNSGETATRQTAFMIHAP